MNSSSSLRIDVELAEKPGGSSFDPLIKALAPVLAAGLALQQLFELIDPFLDQLSKTAKSYATSITSLILGFLLAWLGGFQV